MATLNNVLTLLVQTLQTSNLPVFLHWGNARITDGPFWLVRTHNGMYERCGSFGGEEGAISVQAQIECVLMWRSDGNTDDLPQRFNTVDGMARYVLEVVPYAQSVTLGPVDMTADGELASLSMTITCSTVA